MSNRPIDSKCNTSDPACVKEAWDRAISNDPSPSAYLGLMGEATKGVGKGLFDAAAFPSDVFYYVTMKDSQFHERRSISAWGREGISWQDNPITRGADVVLMAFYGIPDALSGHLANYVFNDKLEWGIRYLQPPAKDVDGIASEYVTLPFIYSLARGIGRRAVGAPREAEAPKTAREKVASEEPSTRRFSPEPRAIPADAGFIDLSFILRSRPVQWLRWVIQCVIEDLIRGNEVAWALRRSQYIKSKHIPIIIEASSRNMVAMKALEILAKKRPDLFRSENIPNIIRITEKINLREKAEVVQVLNDLANTRPEIFRPEHIPALIGYKGHRLYLQNAFETTVLDELLRSRPDLFPEFTPQRISALITASEADGTGMWELVDPAVLLPSAFSAEHISILVEAAKENGGAAHALKCLVAARPELAPQIVSGLLEPEKIYSGAR